MLTSRNHSFVLIFFIIFNLNGLVFTKKLPVYLRNLKCPMTKEYDSCFLLNANKAIPLIVNGDPEYGIPKMTPLQIPFISFVSTPTLKVNLTNVEVYGLDRMIITDHESDLEKLTFHITLKGENITVVGDYEANGNILIMPLRGKGGFSMYFKNGLYNSFHAASIIEKNGVRYFKPRSSRFSAKLGQIIFHLDNLFEGNKMLGEQVNLFLNENWETLVADFGPSIGNTISQIINGIFEDVAAAVPIKDIFL